VSDAAHQLELPLCAQRVNDLLAFRLEQLRAKLAVTTCAGERADIEHDIRRLELLVAQPTPREVGR